MYIHINVGGNWMVSNHIRKSGWPFYFIFLEWERRIQSTYFHHFNPPGMGFLTDKSWLVLPNSKVVNHGSSRVFLEELLNIQLCSHLLFCSSQGSVRKLYPPSVWLILSGFVFMQLYVIQIELLLLEKLSLHILHLHITNDTCSGAELLTGLR